MAGSFSGHLVDSYLSSHQYARGPFGQNIQPSIATCGPMAYAPQVHGTFNNMQPSMSTVDPIYMDLSEETASRIATLQAKLNKKLGPEYISQRPGPGGGMKLTYAEGWKIINLANEVFGFNGWSSSVVNLTTDFIDFSEESRRYTVGVTAVVRVTLRDGVFHEDVGYGMLENSKSKGAALDKCKKEAVTDAVKRSLRNFGNLLGNCLYDKNYTQEVTKIKVPPPKFDRSELHRRPEFDENRSNGGPNTASTSTSVPSTTKPMHPTGQSSNAPSSHNATSSVPQRTGVAASSAVTTNGTSKANSHMSVVESSAPAQPKTATVSSTAGPQKTAPAYQHSQQHRPSVSTSGDVGRQSEMKPPPQPAPLAERRVSFAAQPPLNAAGPTTVPLRISPPVAATGSADSFEDEYGLNSEDDAFLATVDLGEELGRPIDYDESVQEDFSSIDASLENMLVDADASVLGGGGYQHKKVQFRPEQVANGQPSEESKPNPPYSDQQQAAVGTTASRRPLPGNMPPAKPPPNHSSAPRSTPSSGGFHFPPGVNLRSSGPQGSLGIGIKRPADAMRDNSGRRPAQGMGLSHQSGAVAPSSGRRDPLASLSTSDGGDPKRLKR